MRIKSYWYKGEKEQTTDREYRRRSRKNNPEKHRQEVKEYNRKYPERRKARETVKQALYKGILKKEPCVVCGVDKVQAHHPDYSKPIDIIWLCPSHHKQVDLGIIKLMKLGTKKFGLAGANAKWSNYRDHLIKEVSKLVTKQELDFYLVVEPFTKPGAYRRWREALMELRKRK